MGYVLMKMHLEGVDGFVGGDETRVLTFRVVMLRLRSKSRVKGLGFRVEIRVKVSRSSA